MALIHLHNISACREGLLEALEDSGIPFGYTLHDLNFACPTITFLDAGGRYCGGVTDARTCQACVAAQPAFAGVDVEAWRARHGALVERAAFVIAPSQWAATMLDRYFPRNDVIVIPHGTAASSATRAPGTRLGVLMPDDDVPVIAALGAIGPDKGARRIEALVERMRALDLPLRIVVIGYLDVERGPWQSDDARLTVHGRYDSRDLAALVAALPCAVRAVSVGGSGNVQLYAVGVVARGRARARAADRRARRARQPYRRGMGAGRRRVDG